MIKNYQTILRNYCGYCYEDGLEPLLALCKWDGKTDTMYSQKVGISKRRLSRCCRKQRQQSGDALWRARAQTSRLSQSKFMQWVRGTCLNALLLPLDTMFVTASLSWKRNTLHKREVGLRFGHGLSTCKEPWRPPLHR